MPVAVASSVLISNEIGIVAMHEFIAMMLV